MNLIVENMMNKEFKKLQDDQICKFLKKRYQIINIDMDYIKTNIRIEDFKDKDDQVLLIFSILILKNANNLILELGEASFMTFLSEFKEQLFE